MASTSSMPDRHPLLITIGILLLILTLPSAGYPRPEEGYIAPASTPWQAETIDLEPLNRKIASLETEITALSTETENAGPFEERITQLRTQVHLLERLAEIIRTEANLKQDMAQLSDKQAALDASIRALESRPPVEPPDRPTREGYQHLAVRLQRTNQELAELRKRSRDTTNRIEGSAEEQRAYHEMIESARQAVLSLSEKFQENRDAARKAILYVQLQNARIQKRMGEEGLSLLDLMETHAEKMTSFWNRRIDYLQRRVFREEKTYTAYRKALEAALAAEQEAQTRVLEAKKTVAAQAEEGTARFIADYETQIARAQADISVLNRKATAISDIEKRIRQRLEDEKARFDALKTLVQKAGGTGETGRRLRNFFQRIQENRSRLHFFEMKELSADFEHHRNRRFEIEEQLLNIEENWQEELSNVTATLPESQRAEFASRALSLREEWRTNLLEELDLLNQLIQTEENVQDLKYAFSTLMDDMEQFLMPRLFWIRDAEPVGTKTPAVLNKDLTVLTEWAKAVRQEAGRHRSDWLIPRGVVLSIMFVAIGGILIHLLIRRRRRGVVIREGLQSKIRSFIQFLLLCCMMPVYLYLAAILIRFTSLPGEMQLVLAGIFTELALIALIGYIARVFFSDPDTSAALFGLSPETAAAIYRFLNTLVVLRLVLTVIPAVLNRPPFMTDSFLALADLVFTVALLVPIYRLIRPASPLGKNLVSVFGSGLLGRNWGGFVILILSVMAGSAVMGAMGYRYGASRIYDRSLWTLMIGLIGIGIHQWLGRIVQQHAVCMKAQECSQASTEEEAAEIRHLESRCIQFQKFISISCVALTFFAIAMAWGINQQVVKSLDNIPLYTVTTDLGVVPVTLADLAYGAVILLVMMVLLKNLPSIYEVILFQRLDVDSGLRYALLNITRYGIFFVGVLIAMAQIHLDLSQVTWLMAAVGFGLGFGMQEIFSNFVSGLILLVERPVRVGDIVKVGGILGTVSRINIRATTVTDFDRLEVVIPNKDFITRDVTNWTLGDRIIRIIVPIGVAYGTDPDRVDDILLKIAAEDPDVMEDPEPGVLFMEHGDSSLNFELRCYLDEPNNLLKVKSRLNHKINKALAENGIEIPFPQRDIHIRTVSESKTAAWEDGVSDIPPAGLAAAGPRVS